MKAIILYHPNSEGSRLVEEYAQRFHDRSGLAIELQSLETRDGASTATLYDIVRYPAVMVLDDAGQMQKSWQEDVLPLMDEVAGYLVAHA
jgi:hypothetical protein